MKYYLAAFSLCLSLVPMRSSAQYHILWENCYGGSGAEISGDILETTNGDFILVAASQSEDGDLADSLLGSYDYWVANLDRNGVIIWENRFGGKFSDVPNQVLQDKSFGYLISGYSGSKNHDVDDHYGGAGVTDVWLIKINPDGDIMWKKSYGGTNNDIPSQIIQTPDNGFILAGTTASSDGDVENHIGNNDIWLLKMDSVMNVKWSDCYGGSDIDYGRAVTFNGNKFKVSGTSYSNDGDIVESNGISDFVFLETDSTGNLEWIKNYGGSQFDQSAMHIQIKDSTYVIVGMTDSDDGDILNPGPGQSGWLLNTDSLGDMLFNSAFEGQSGYIIFQILPLYDSGYLCVADFTGVMLDGTSDHGMGDILLLTLNHDFEITGQQCFGGSGSDWDGHLEPTADGGYILIGITNSADGDVSGYHDNNDVWIAKIGTCRDTLILQSLSICDGDSIFFGNTWHTASGIYTDSLYSTGGGCDSIVITNLSMIPILDEIYFATDHITAAQNDAAYQWIDCSTGEPITGAIQQTYFPPGDGQYAVIISLDGCTDTSDCIYFTKTGIKPLPPIQIEIFPNPADETLFVQSSVLISSAEIFTIEGEFIYHEEINGSNFMISIHTNPSGVYILHLIAGTNAVQQIVFVKQ